MAILRNMSACSYFADTILSALLKKELLAIGLNEPLHFVYSVLLNTCIYIMNLSPPLTVTHTVGVSLELPNEVFLAV